MNEYDPSLDEIVSAYVDGVATPDERARVEGDPALVERAASFRRVQEALATPAPAPAPAPASDDLRSSLIARALAETAPAVATVHPLRSRRVTALGPIVAAAAVIALFFGLGTWLVAAQDNNDDSASSTAGAPSVAEDLFDAKSQLGASAATTAATGAAGGSAATGANPESAKAPPPYLGAFDNLASLRAALASSADAAGTTPPTTSVARQAASTPLCGRTDPPDARIYRAVLAGRPVTIVVTATRIDLYDDATCAGPTNLLTAAPR